MPETKSKSFKNVVSIPQPNDDFIVKNNIEVKKGVTKLANFIGAVVPTWDITVTVTTELILDKASPQTDEVIATSTLSMTFTIDASSEGQVTYSDVVDSNVEAEVVLSGTPARSFVSALSVTPYDMGDGKVDFVVRSYAAFKNGGSSGGGSFTGTGMQPLTNPGYGSSPNHSRTNLTSPTDGDVELSHSREGSFKPVKQ